MAKVMPLAARLAALAYELRVRSERPTNLSRAKSETAGLWRRVVASAERHGSIDIYEKDGRVRAALAFYREQPFYSKTPLPMARILLDRSDRQAFAWLKKQLVTRQNAFRKGLRFGLNARDVVLLPQLLSQGMHIESILLRGYPRTALRGVTKRYGKLNWKDVKGLELAKLTTKREIDDLLRIEREEFRRNPQFGWFVGTPRFQKWARSQLEEARKKKPCTEYIILERGRVVGHFGFRIFAKGRTKSAGVGITLSQSIQGRGLAKYAYATMLREMVKLGVSEFQGNTAQAPVIRLGRIMRRPLVAYLLEYGDGYFDRHHFRYPRELCR